MVYVFVNPGEGSMAGVLVNVVTLSLFFLPGALAACSDPVHLLITTPKKMKALEGSCLQVPCNYRAVDGGNANFDKTKKIVGIWTNLDSNIDSVNITGNLTELNCTSVFFNLAQGQKEYFFRIENDEFKATADCDGLHITVKDSPWNSTITISGDLKEKERVTITCSAVTPCPHSPPELTWNLQQDSHTQTKKYKDGTLKTKIQKIITLSDTHDGYTINCSATYPVNGGKDFKTSLTVKTLSVSYAPKNTSASISPAGLVSAGSWVNLTCSSRANPPVSSFTWFKKREHGDMRVAEGDFYSLNVTDGGEYYCVASNNVGNQTSNNIPINVIDSPWSPTMTISGDLKENERVNITCSAVTPCPHSPPELTWNLQQDSHTQTEKNKDGTLKTKIQEIITLSDTHDGYNISCSARYPVNGGKPFKTSQTVKTLSVSYAPKNTSASISPAGLVSAGSWVNLTCSSRANPPVSSFTWFKKREHGDMRVAEGDFYSLNVTDGGVYYCVAKNSVGNQTSPDIHLNVDGLPGGFLLWQILRYIIGFIFLVGCVCVVIWSRRTKDTNSTMQQLQILPPSGHLLIPLTCASPPISTPGFHGHQFPFIYRPTSTCPLPDCLVFMSSFPAFLSLSVSACLLLCLIHGFWIFACSLWICLPVCPVFVSCLRLI
ncbi:B-cell receptor CD22-like [Cololabis saira]|uniref:B-cell receptor CD22-like n=1 Tax=Cololabis saira TaxID=129043 RepID=UPI002AD4588C|nr:B-cell receptor CD22-like [Cololabis saira]